MHCAHFCSRRERMFRRSARVSAGTLELVRHDDAAKFLQAAAAVLQKSKAANSAFVSWAKAFVRNPPAEGERLLLATVHLRGMPVGIAFRRGKGPLIVGESSPASAVVIA